MIYCELVHVRLIPACAGSTSRGRRPARPSRAHPRMRGEHDDRTADGRPARGSSPHARGARLNCRIFIPITGLIPACAGSTCALLARARVFSAHPRMRGEHLAEDCKALAKDGSSPHARGARGTPHRLRRRRGLIPACAGSTTSSPPTGAPPPAHPRMRGEHDLGATGFIERVGSSPHARGAP